MIICVFGRSDNITNCRWGMMKEDEKGEGVFKEVGAGDNYWSGG